MVKHLSYSTYEKGDISLQRRNILLDKAMVDIFKAIALWILDKEKAFQVALKISFKGTVARLNKKLLEPPSRILCRTLADKYKVREKNF